VCAGYFTERCDLPALRGNTQKKANCNRVDGSNHHYAANLRDPVLSHHKLRQIVAWRMGSSSQPKTILMYLCGHTRAVPSRRSKPLGLNAFNPSQEKNS